MRLAKLTHGQEWKVALLRDVFGFDVAFRPTDPIDEELCKTLETLHERVLHEILSRVL